MASVAAGLASLWTSSLSGSVLGMAASALLARLITPLEMGRMAILASVAAFFYSLLFTWMQVPFVRFGKQALEQTGRVAPAWVRKAPLLLGSALALALCLSPHAMRLWAPVFGLVPSWSAGLLLLWGVASLWAQEEASILAQIHENFRVMGALPAVQKLLWLGLLGLFFFAAARPDHADILWAYWGSSLVAGAGALLLFAKSGSAPARGEYRVSTGEIFRHCIPVCFSASVGFLSNFGDHWILSFYCRMEDVGQFQVAYQMFTIVSGLALAFSQIFLPRVVREEYGGASRAGHNMRAVFPAMNLAWCACLVPGGALLPEVFLLVFSRAYEPAVPTLLVLLGGAAFAALPALYAPYFHIQSRLMTAALYMTAMTASNLAVSLALTPHLGPLGGAIGTSLSFVCIACLYLFDQQRRFSVREQTQLMCSAAALLLLWAQAALCASLFARLTLGLGGLCLYVLYARRRGLFADFDFSLLPAHPAWLWGLLQALLVPPRAAKPEDGHGA